MISSSSESEPAEGEDVVPLDAEDDNSPRHDVLPRSVDGIQKVKVEVQDDDKPWRPLRVTQCLQEAGTFSEFREARVFTFLHLFSGEEDVLAEALVTAGKKEAINVHVTSVDRAGSNCVDLSKDQPFGEILDDVRGGLFDGGHAGFPCGSFSMVRHRPGGPPPVRSLAHIYGLPTNNPSQQREADNGTVLAIRSLQVISELIQAQRLRKVPDCGTLENPPGSDNMSEGPAWQLPEFLDGLKKLGAVLAKFNTCAYQMKFKKRWFKPGQFGGCLADLASMRRTCKCPSDYKHDPLLGKRKTSEAARYPAELCQTYADLVIKVFKVTLNLEWWRFQEESKKTEVNRLQKNWLNSKLRKQITPPLPLDQVKEMRGLKRAWHPLDDQDHLPQPVEPPKKARREAENRFYLGGMRNPLAAVRKTSRLEEAGRDVFRLWSNFVRDWPDALQVAKDYGSDHCGIDSKLKEKWSEQLGKLLKVEKPAVVLKSPLAFTSPLNAEFWKAWQAYAKDPEEHVHQWAVHGVPLGMEEVIPGSNGVFPPVFEDPNEPMVAPELNSQWDTRNYKSMYEDKEPAKKELQRLVDKGFAVIMSKSEATEKFKVGTMSKLALITKKKENYIKYRIIIDLLRSGGNRRCVVPERIVLPRIQDIVHGLRDLWTKFDTDKQKDEDWGIELIGADLSDAYCHFPVAVSELGNCLAPGLEEDQVVCFRAMLFGFKAAPLLMGRLSACFSRMWQAFIPRGAGFVQTYMDDPVVVLVGPRKLRETILSLILYSAELFGLNLSYAKAERGLQLKWIGINIEVDPELSLVNLTVPDKLVEEIKTVLESWKSTVTIRELRSVTGKLSWLAGVLTRSRWAVSILYAVIASVEDKEQEKVNESKGSTGHGVRAKWIHASRVDLPRRFFLTLCNKKTQWMTRSIPLSHQKVRWAITTDACPLGIGGVLAAVNVAENTLIPVAAFRAKITPEVAKDLGIEYGLAAGQGALEAFAVLVAIRHWASKLAGERLMLQSDSTVALALARKLSSSSPTLNWVGAEMALQAELLSLQEFVLHHIPGKLNVAADWLSRPSMTSDLPAELKDVNIKILAEKTLLQPSIAPPGLQPKLWGKLPKLSGAFDHL